MSGDYRLPTRGRGGWFGLVVLLAAVASMSRTALTDVDTGRQAPGELAAAVAQAAPPLSSGQVRRLVAHLDAASFERRNEASRELVKLGPATIPFVIEGLAQASGEVQLRARWILNHFDFVEVAPRLLERPEDPVPRAVRELLRAQARQHLTVVCARPHAEQLLRMLQTDAERFTFDALKQLHEASTRDAVRAAVKPLLKLTSDIDRFNEAAERLAALALPSEHQDGTGAIVLSLVARGLRDERSEFVHFAEAYLSACEAFVAARAAEGATPATIRQELTQRADWSRGATQFVISLQEAGSRQRTRLEQETTLRAADLEAAFFAALAAPRPQAFTQGVGKVHIADMLVGALGEWSEGRDDPLVAQLVQGTTEAALAGDKPRALGYLDALDACRALPQHGLHLASGLGRKLAMRLAEQAAAAPHFKAYHPARSLHDKILSVRARGLREDHPHFPHALVDKYVAGADEAWSESTRLELDRLVRKVTQLQRTDPQLAAPATHEQLEASLAALNASLVEGR